MPAREDSVVELYWDPYDVPLDDDPYPVWAAMRERAPVYRNDRYDFWALSRAIDVESAHADTETYSSSKGTVLEQMGGDMAATGMMIFIDPPDHTVLRKLVSGAMTPRRVAALEESVRLVCAELLDPLIGMKSFDYVQDFAAQVPSRVISSLVGVPKDDQEEMRRNVDGMFHLEPDSGMANETAVASGRALTTYLSDLVVERSSAPRQDMISALVQARIVDEAGVMRRLTNHECTQFAVLLYTAGTETVVKLLGNAAVLLGRHPAQRADLLRNPTLIGNAVEELLRYEPPSPVQGRWTTRDITIHRVKIPKGSKVLLLTGSAGRDASVYPDGDKFDVHRANQRHLSLGHGVHFCLGAALARLEARVAIDETLKRFPAWQVVENDLERVHTSTVRGYRKTPIMLESAGPFKRTVFPDGTV